MPRLIDGIETNLTKKEMREVLSAIDNKKAVHVPDTTSVFAGSAGCQYDYKGSRYEIAEHYEETIGLFRVDPKDTVGLASIRGALETFRRI